MNYIGFGIRFVAWLIDLIVVVVISGILGAILGLLGSNMASVSNVLGIIIVIGYYVFYQQYTGQTLGKKAMSIKVVDQNGKRPTYLTFFLREVVGKFISGLIFGLGYLWILWDPKKQGWHDKIASTFVVKA